MGKLGMWQGDFEAAFSELQESLAIWREVGDQWGIAFALGGLGHVARGKGDYSAARSFFLESLEIRSALEHNAGIASSLHGLGAVAFDEGDSSAAGGKILEYWNRYGGLKQFGFPLSEPFQEVSTADGKTYTVQYFERNRFELHPKKAAPYEVGLGIQEPTPSWGNLLQGAQEYSSFITDMNPTKEIRGYLILFPGFMILLTVLCINFIGDALRDALDPRMKT